MHREDLIVRLQERLSDGENTKAETTDNSSAENAKEESNDDC